MLPPTLDEHLGFEQRVEQLAVEQLIAELAVEGFDVAIFPMTSWFDEQCLYFDALKSIANLVGGELRPTGTDAQRWSAADVLWDTATDEQVA